MIIKRCAMRLAHWELDERSVSLHRNVTASVYKHRKPYIKSLNERSRPDAITRAIIIVLVYIHIKSS